MRSIRQMEPQVDGDEPVGGLSCAEETGKNASDCAFYTLPDRPTFSRHIGL